MRLRLSAFGAVAAVSLAIGLAACGSSSKSSSPPTTAPTAASTTPTSSAASTTPSSAVASPSTTTASTANFNSCSVVTQAEASSAIGQAVTAGILGSATVEGGLACVFYGPSAPTPRDPNVAQTDSVRVVVVEGSNALTWYNNYKSKVRAQPISGYGDQAYWDGYASLSVLKGDTYLRIAVAPAAAAPSLTDEEQLATAILPKL